jgi:hypothetical protein
MFTGISVYNTSILDVGTSSSLSVQNRVTKTVVPVCFVRKCNTSSSRGEMDSEYFNFQMISPMLSEVT